MQQIKLNQRQRQVMRLRRMRFSTQISGVGLAIGVTLAGGIWAVREAIVPEVAQASITRLTLTLQREPEESFQTMVRRAESVARAAVQRSFDSDILVTDVLVTIVGENRGLAAPILEIQVSRADWRSRPDPQRWATYFRTARVLLEMDGAPATDPQPEGVGQPVPTGAAPAPVPDTSVPDTSVPAPVTEPQPAIVDPNAAPPAIPLPQEVPGNPVVPQSVPATPQS